MPDLFGNKTFEEMLAERQQQQQALFGGVIKQNMAQASSPEEIAGTGIGNFLGALGVKYFGGEAPLTPEMEAAKRRQEAQGGISSGGTTLAQKQAQLEALRQYNQQYGNPASQEFQDKLQQEIVGIAKQEEERANLKSFADSVRGEDPVGAKAIESGLIKPLEYKKQVLEEQKHSEQARPIIEFEKDGEVITQKWNRELGDYETIAKSPVKGNYMPADEQIKVASETKKAEKLAEYRAKGIAERETEDMATATLAADSVPVLTRSLELLGDIKTGNVEGLLLKGKRFLGVESADEAELVNNLNKRVIAQLKPVFGNQFTAKEGQWLKEIEASESKSTEGNIRLMKTGINLARERAERGLEAAKTSGDVRTQAVLERFLTSTPEQIIGKSETVVDKPVQEMSDDELMKSLGL